MKLYPYPHFQEAVRLFLSKGLLLPLETALAPDEIDRDLYVVHLDRRDLAIHPRVRLNAEVFASRADADRFNARDGDNVQAYLVAHCRTTRIRASFPLTHSRTEAGQWYGNVELDRRLLRGTVSLRAVLTDTHTSTAHRLLAASDPWRVIVDKTDVAAFSAEFTPDVRWTNFRAVDALPHLQRDADQPYYLDLYEPVPVVYLNAGFPGLPDLFPVEAKPEGLLLPLHEALCSGITRSVWQALTHAALMTACQLYEEEAEPVMPPGWQGIVLQHLLPRIYPGASPLQALTHAVRDARSDAVMPLQSRILSVINSLIGDGRSLRRALSALNEHGSFGEDKG